jgi:hypothetical protein
MTVAAWLPTHAYATDALANPTVSNGNTFRAATGGTSAGSEPTWSGRYGSITDGTVTWVPYTVVKPSQVRDMMSLTTSGSDQYTDNIIGQNLLDAISSLEQTTRRFLANTPGATVTMTSMLRASLPIPALRTPTTIVYAGTTLTSGAYWLLPDVMNSGVSTGIQFRALRTSDSGPWWLADPLWFDKALDSPFYPGNYGGGYAFTSMPNDSAFTGDWGWEPTFEPGDFVHALMVFAAWYTARPPALLADSVITPAGGIVNYAMMPPEVQAFVKQWSAGQQVVSIG